MSLHCESLGRAVSVRRLSSGQLASVLSEIPLLQKDAYRRLVIRTAIDVVELGDLLDLERPIAFDDDIRIEELFILVCKVNPELHLTAASLVDARTGTVYRFSRALDRFVRVKGLLRSAVHDIEAKAHREKVSVDRRLTEEGILDFPDISENMKPLDAMEQVVMADLAQLVRLSAQDQD